MSKLSMTYIARMCLSISLCSYTQAGTRITFAVPNEVLQVYVSASIEQVGMSRDLRVAVVKDKADCCHGTIEFVALVDHDGATSEFPISVKEDEVSGQSRVSAGTVKVSQIRLKLTHAELSRDQPAKLYDGLVGKDEACMSDAIKAREQGGNEGRKALSEMIDNGCIQATPYVMAAGPLAKVL